MEKEEKKTIEGSISSFVYKYRVALIVIVAVLVLGGIAAGVVVGISEKNTEKGYSAYDTLVYNLSNYQNDSNLTADEVAAKEADILAQAKDLASKNAKNGVGAHAFMLVGGLEFGNGNFENAKNAWLSAAAADSKSYTAPVSYYNAGVACEELKDFDGAVANIEKALSYDNFLLKAKAIFNLGRIEEQRGNIAKAAEYYTKLNDEYSGDQYANLAKSRLIYFEVAGQI